MISTILLQICCRDTLHSLGGIAGDGTMRWVGSVVDKARMAQEYLQFSLEHDEWPCSSNRWWQTVLCPRIRIGDSECPVAQGWSSDGWDNQNCQGRREKTAITLNVSHLTDALSKVRWSCATKTAVHQLDLGQPTPPQFCSLLVTKENLRQSVAQVSYVLDVLHPTTSVKALGETQSTNPNQGNITYQPHPWFIHHQNTEERDIDPFMSSPQCQYHKHSNLQKNAFQVINKYIHSNTLVTYKQKTADTVSRPHMEPTHWSVMSKQKHGSQPAGLSARRL